MDVTAPNANHLYTAALDATRPDLGLDIAAQEGQPPEGFFDALADAAQETVRTIANGEDATAAMMAGKADAHSVVEALAAAEMALEMAVAVRNKVVEAYQEILRMPI